MSEKFVKIKQTEFERIKKIAEENKVRYKVISADDNIEYPELGSKEIVKIKNDYQLKHSPYYLGSDSLYRENLYFIRQYPDYKRVVDSGLNAEPAGDMPVRGGGISKPTERDAIRNVSIDEAGKKIHIIEEAIRTIPEAYRKGVFKHVVYQTAYCDKMYHYANINTWKRWTQKFVYEVAIRRGQKDFIDALRNRK